MRKPPGKIKKYISSSEIDFLQNQQGKNEKQENCIFTSANDRFPSKPTKEKRGTKRRRKQQHIHFSKWKHYALVPLSSAKPSSEFGFRRPLSAGAQVTFSKVLGSRVCIRASQLPRGISGLAPSFQVSGDAIFCLERFGVKCGTPFLYGLKPIHHLDTPKFSMGMKKKKNSPLTALPFSPCASGARCGASTRRADSRPEDPRRTCVASRCTWPDVRSSRAQRMPLIHIHTFGVVQSSRLGGGGNWVGWGVLGGVGGIKA